MANKSVSYDEIVKRYSKIYDLEMAVVRCQQNINNTLKRIVKGQDGNLESWEKALKHFKTLYIKQRIEKLNIELKEIEAS